jgi:DNA-binding MarR family transcriptional regulator
MGLTPARASALSVLVFGGPRTVGELAAAEGVQSPTMTQLVNSLEALELARRVPAPGDRRRVMVEATEAGRRLLEEGRARRVALLDSLLDELDDTELAVLDRAAITMEAVVARFRGGPERPRGATGGEQGRSPRR